jgi:hypothetical protein
MTFTTEQHVRKPWGWFACKMNKNTIKADDWDPLIHIMLMFRWHNIFNRTHFSVGLKAIDFFFIWSGFHGTYQTTRKKYCFYDILGSTWPLGKFATFPCGVTNQLAWEILVCFNSYMVRHGIFELSCGYDIFIIMFFFLFMCYWIMRTKRPKWSHSLSVYVFFQEEPHVDQV